MNPALLPPVALLAMNAPTPLPPGAAEALARGEVVLASAPPRLPASVRLDAWVDVPADAVRTWTALVDHAARDRASRTIVGAELYRTDDFPDGSTRRCVRWEGSRFGLGFVYHHCYLADAGHTRLAHTLDPDRPSDLRLADGVFELSTPAPGRTRVHYAAETVLSEAMPEFLVGWVSGTNAREFLSDVRARASTLPVGEGAAVRSAGP